MQTKMADNFGYLPHYIRFRRQQIAGFCTISGITKKVNRAATKWASVGHNTGSCEAEN